MTHERMQFTPSFFVKCQYSKSNVFVTYIIRFFLIKVDDTFKVAPQGNNMDVARASVIFWNLVFAFVFTPSSLKLIKYNKQGWNSVLQPFLLKYWV